MMVDVDWFTIGLSAWIVFSGGQIQCHVQIVSYFGAGFYFLSEIHILKKLDHDFPHLIGRTAPVTFLSRASPSPLYSPVSLLLNTSGSFARMYVPISPHASAPS